MQWAGLQFVWEKFVTRSFLAVRDILFFRINALLKSLSKFITELQPKLNVQGFILSFSSCHMDTMWTGAERTKAALHHLHR